MGAPIVYKSTDSQAPVLNGIAGSLINLLRKVLVDGYGTKPGAGWTLEFINAAQTIAVFRNNSTVGFGKYFRVDDSIGTYATVTGYETMADIDNGLGRIPGGDGSSTVYYIAKSAAATTVARPYVLIADSREIWAVLYFNETVLSGSSYNGGAYFLGDGVPIDALDRYCSGIIAGTTAGGTVVPMFPRGVSLANGTLSGAVLYRDYTGATKAPLFSLSVPAFVYGYPGAAGFSGAINGQYQFFRPEIIFETLTYRLHGVLPGLYYSSHLYTTFTTLQEIEVEESTLLALRVRSAANDNTQFFIDISGNFRP